MLPKFSVDIVASSIMLTATCVTTPAIAYTIQPLSADTTGFSNLINEFQQKFVQPESLAIPDPEARVLNPERLRLSIDSNIRIFFLNEGAGKLNNQLKFTASGYGEQPSESIFGSISCSDPKCRIPEANGPLHIGDWVDLGNFVAGTSFNFLLESQNGIDGQTDVYSPNPVLNLDRLSHLVAYEYKGFVVLGFEDLFGPEKGVGGRNENSDRDFNDVMFVTNLPVSPPEPPESVPEPSATLPLVGIGLLGLIKLRRHLISQLN